MLAVAVFYIATGVVAARHAWRVAPPPVREPATSLVVALFFACGVLAGPQAAVPVPVLALLGLAAWNGFFPSQLPPGDVSLYLLQPFAWAWLVIYAGFVVAAYVRRGRLPGQDGPG